MMPTIQDVSSRCSEVGDCLLWNGKLSKDGTPVARVWGPGKGRTMGVHRLMWLLLHPDHYINGLVVWQYCGNRRCVAPGHLALVPRERFSPRGDANGSSRLTAEIVKEARLLHQAGSSTGELAKTYGVSYTAMLNAVKGQTWKQVPMTPPGRGSTIGGDG